LKAVLNSIELFPAEMLDEIIANYVDDLQCKDIWLIAIIDEQAIGLAYCGPETLTVGTYNLYAIGVESKLKGKEIGKK